MKILIGILILSIIVFFHELGHFIFAKIFGVKVLSFSIGMGPVLLHKKIKDTDYRISLLPFGGYCGMEGEDDFRKAIEENLSSIPKNENSLYGVHPLKRALIAFAGPLFNFIFAIVAFTIINMTSYEYYTLSNKIIIPDSSVISPARDAGLLTGDKIISINNEPIETFNDIQEIISLNPKKELTIKVERDSQILTFNITTTINKEYGNGILGIMGDNNSLMKLNSKTYSLFPAIYHGFIDMIDYFCKTIQSFGILFKGVDVTNVVSGPVRITSMLGDIVTEGFNVGYEEGIYSICSFCALICISLGIMNLLPIPILDGGIILFALISLITKKEVSPKIQYKIQIIGIIFIIFLFILGTTGDIKYFINKWSK